MFCENNVPSLYEKLLKLQNRFIHIQILQTYSILIMNLTSHQNLYYIFSHRSMTYMIQHEYNFKDEEIVNYFISFIKSLSVRLDVELINFFYNSVY